MKSRVENTSSSINIAKWLLAIVVIAAAIVANSVFESVVALPLRIGAGVIIICFSGFILYTTSQGRQVKAFAADSHAELLKVFWPTRKETLQTTLLVMAMTLALGIILWIVDSVLIWAISLITR